MRFPFFLLVVSIVFGGCVQKHFTSKKTQIVTIKSPLLRFNDVGYILHNGESVELQIYSAGAAVERISVNHMVCTDKGCMSKAGFNETYLNAAYGEEFLKNILMRRPIYNGKNLHKLPNGGFVQKIHNDYVDIVYKVEPHLLYFKDKRNRILIKFKEIG